MTPQDFGFRKLDKADWNALSGEERMRIGAMMFDVWREKLIATFPDGLSKREFKRLLYQRTYGQPAPEDAFPD